MSIVTFHEQSEDKIHYSKGFTLAEVLITLGIIGVVAAMTLPALIQNYQKGVALNRLKQTFSQVATAVEAVGADFDTLPIHQWSCKEGFGDEYTYNQESCFYLAMEKVAQKMYGKADSLSHVFCYEGKEYRPYKSLDGNTGFFETGGSIVVAGSWSAKMPNGACVVWNPWAWANDASGTFVIDVDGPYSGYNTMGKDVFIYRYARANTGKGLGPNGRSLYPLGFDCDDDECKSVSPWIYNSLKNGCTKNTGFLNFGKTCAARIMLDGWQMAKDYPW